MHLILVLSTLATGGDGGVVEARARPVEGLAWTDAGRSMDEFYSADGAAQWEPVLGDAMHYHHGIFEEEDLNAKRLSDQQADRAMAKAIAVLYPYIPQGASILDVGCGWCGPARQLHAEHACEVTGVTASADQAEYCSARGGVENIIHADANSVLPLRDGAHYDVALLMESISHVQDKRGLLEELSKVAGKLVLRVNTYDGPATDDDTHRTVFGGSMLLPSTVEMKQLVEAAGWDIVRVENIRRRTKPTLIVYKQRIAAAAAAAPVTGSAADTASTKNKTQLQWLTEGVAHADGADDVAWAWGMTHGLVDIVAVPRRKPETENNVNKQQQQQQHTTGTATYGGQCSASVAEARETLLAFVRKSTESLALAPIAEVAGGSAPHQKKEEKHAELGFEDLLNCVLDVVAEEEECATSAALVDKLLLTSTKIVQRSSDALVANSNRYAVFLDPSVLGADLARKAAKTCLETTLRAPPAVTARLAETPRDAVLCLSQEWATPDGATAATGRYYYQREGAAGTVTEEPIQSWQWNLAGSAANADTTIVPRVYSRHQGNTTTAGAAAGAAAAAHVCGEEGFPASSVVDLAQLSAITAIEACWAVAKAGAASKHDLRIAPTTFGAVLSALRLPNDLAQHPLFAAVHDTAVSLVAASQESATLYFSPQEIDASSPFGAVTPADDADALLDLAEQQCAAAADGKVIPAPALGAWAAEVEPKLAAAFGLADLGNFMDDGFGKRHRHWSGAATTGVTVQDIQAGLTAAFDAGGSSGMLLNYRRNTARVSAEHGPQTASDLFAELAARGAAEPLSAVLEDADKLQFDTDADGIAKLRDELQKVLGLEVNVNMYLSAENAAALPPHTDRYDVFVVQLHGAKDWNICPPAASVATTGLNEAEAAMELELAKHSPNGCSAHKNVKSDGTLDCKSVKMAVGDVLYMPKGLVHEAKSVAAGGLSAHLTIGLVQDGLTWTDLFEANAKRLSNVVASSPAVATRLANAVNAVANSVPAGVAWHRALPVGASQHAIGSLHNYYDDLGKQLQAAATATLNAATDPFGAQRAEVVAAVQELTRADMMLAGISELQRRAADAREQDSEAASELINVAFESAMEVSLLKRSRKAVGSCHKGQANSRFTCPDSGRSFDKNMQQPIGESCECDGYYGSSCECDQNTKYGKCEVDKDKCKCPPGKRIVGCAKDSAYSGGNCGSCEWNGPGDFCSTSDVKFQCQNGLACLDGYCCHEDVMQQYCTSCAKVGTTKAGKCDKWEKGYKGDYADPQRNGCEKGYYVSPDKSRCLPASSGGDVCSKDSECSAGTCLDKRCCGANVDASACSACGTSGECTACKDTGKDPAFGCARCFANGYFEASRSSETSFTCSPKLQVGKFCQKPDSDNANGGDWIDDHTRCVASDCRNNCCGPDVLGNDRNLAYCSRCGESGECEACPDTFSLAALGNGQQVCKQKCTKDDGTRVEHDDADTRIMYESNEPIGDETCEQMAQTQTRTCNDGTFGAWETENGNNPNDFATCSDRCKAPSVENVFVCKDDRASGANDCDSAATTPYVKHGYVVARVRYLAPSVEPGQECQGENQTQSCVDGELDDLASRCTDGMSTAQQGRAGCTYYTFSTCNVNCAAGCTLEKELDEKQCHDECNVDTCCFQHGTCASKLLDEFAEAKLLAFQEQIGEAQQTLDTICASDAGVGDDAQVEIKNSACMMATSMEMGLDFLGRDQNFVDPLGWEAYNRVAISHIEALEALEEKLNNVDERDRQESNFEFLASKMAILQTSQNEMPAGIIRRINALDVNQATAMANLQREIDELSQEQRDNFASVRRGVNQMLLFSETNMQQLSRVEGEMKESEKRMVSDLRDAITDAKDEVTDHLDQNTNMMLAGQDDLMDAIKENGEQLYQIQMAVHELNEQTMENQRLLKKMSGEYDGERADMIHAHAQAQALKDKIESNAGWDVNEDGNVDFDELMEMLQDFEMFEGPALEMMEVVKAANLEERDITLVEVRERIMASGDVRAKKFVENKGLDDLDNAEIDVDADGTISEIEMLAVLTEKFCLLEGGTQMVVDWFAGTLDANGAAMFVPGNGGGRRLGRKRREDLIKSVLPPKWSFYACKIQNSIKTILDAIAPRFSVAMVKDRIERVKALISAIKSLISVVSETIASCGAAVASIIGAIASGGASLAVTGGQTISDIGSCISGISETISQAQNTFEDTIELGKLLYEDVMAIVDMVKAVIEIAKDDECELLEGADVRSLVAGIVGFAQDNLELDVAGALEGDRALRIGLEYATRGLEVLADPSAETLTNLIPTEIFGDLGISDNTIAIMTDVVHNALSGEKWNDGISNAMIAGALHDEFETFTDAVGLGPLVDKIEHVIDRVGKLAPPGTVDKFIADLGQGRLPTAEDLDRLVSGLPKLLSNFAGEQVTAFVAGLGDNSVLDKISGVVAQVGKFLPPGVLDTVLDGLNPGDLPLPEALGAFIAGLPDQIEDLQAGKIPAFVEELKGMWPPKVDDITHLIGELGRAVPELSVVDRFVSTLTDAVGPGTQSLKDFVAALPKALTKLAKAKIGNYVGSLKGKLADMLPDDIAEIISFAGKPLPIGTAIEDFIVGLVQGDGFDPKAAITAFVEGLPGKLTESAEQMLGTFLDGAGEGGSMQDKLIALAKKVGKDIPGVDQIATFVQQASSGTGLTLDFVTEFVAGLADELLPEHASKIQAFVDVVGDLASPDGNQIGTLINALGKVVPDLNLEDFTSPTVNAFLDSLGGMPATFDELKTFVQALPDKLTTVAKSQIGTLLAGLAGGPLQDKIEQLVPKFGKVLPDGAVSGFLQNLANGELDVTSLENFVTSLPNALGLQELDQVKGLTDMLGGGVPSVDQLTTLVTGLGKVVPEAGELASFVEDHLQTGIATVEQVKSFVEILQDGPTSPAAVEKFVQTLGAGMNAQNDWWKAATAGAQLLGEKNVRTSFADVAKNALASTLGFDLGSIFGGGDRRRTRRGAGTGQCHADKTASMSRLFAANRRFEVQRMRSLQNRLLELIHKEKRQLEYKWVTSIDGIELSGLNAADFRVHQAELLKYNLDKMESAAESGVSERSVSFTVDRLEHPEEFAKLGVVDSRELLGRDSNQQQASQMVFLIDAPVETRWYSSYVTEVETLLVPFPGIEGERIEVKITKDTDSLFITEDGLKSSAIRYQHAKTAQDYDYFTADCSAASKPVLQSDTIRYSPYGRWRLEVQTQHITNKAALLDVNQIQFRFKLAQKTIAGARAGLPMFANDSFAGDSGVEILRDDVGCPGLSAFTNLDQSSTGGGGSVDTAADGSSGMSGGAAAGLAIGLILVAGLLVFMLVKQGKASESAQYAEDGTLVSNRRSLPARTFASFKLRLPSIRKRAPTITVEQTTHDRGRSTSVSYQIPMADSIKSISELMPEVPYGGNATTHADIHAAAVKARSKGGKKGAGGESSGIKKKPAGGIQRTNRDGSVYNGFDDVEDDVDAPAAPPKTGKTGKMVGYNLERVNAGVENAAYEQTAPSGRGGRADPVMKISMEGRYNNSRLSVAPVEDRYKNQVMVDVHKDMGELSNNTEL